MRLLLPAFFLLALLSSCGPGQNSDLPLIRGIWLFSSVSFEDAATNSRAIEFKADQTWTTGRVDGNAFFPQDSDTGKWGITAGVRVLSAVDGSGLSNIVSYRFQTDRKLVFESLDNPAQVLYLLRLR